MRVIGTAGHVDHGKSTLIQAMTGIDPDRLQEEKDRGMTIDLGFAWVTLPSGRDVSIVDVPGHERFIKNMLAGVGGIDIALLVIAADEGVMPQTREHLAILDLLDIRTGVVAITKRDLVDQDWLDLVTAEIAEVLQPTALSQARLLPVSSVTREGLPELAAELDRLLGRDRQRRQTGWPRLPIDRVFTMSGFGTVVTGTLIDGELRVGQEIELQPSGQRARIRGLQSHRTHIESAPAGTRVAVNVSGLGVEDIDRGEVLSSPGWLKPSRVVDVRLRVIADVPRPLPHNAQVSFHTGSAEALGRVGLLDSQKLDPGSSGWAQIRLDRPLALARGDPFIIRLPSANITVGGGTIVDDHPKRHRRFQERTLNQLTVLEQGSPGERALQALQSREPAELRELATRLGQTADETRDTLRALIAESAVRVLGAAAPERRPPTGDAAAAGEGWGEGAPPTSQQPLANDVLVISGPGWLRLAGTTTAALTAHHTEHPLRRGMSREELRTRLSLDSRSYAKVERTLVGEALLVEDGPFFRLPEHQVRLSAEQENLAQAMIARLLADGASPPSRALLKTQHQVSDDVLQVLIDRRDLEEVAPDLVYAREVYDPIQSQIHALLAEQGRITVAQVRDATQTSRKYALALLEHLDNLKITRRVGDERVLLGPTPSPSGRGLG